MAINNNLESLASLALFRELYDSKKDIYHVISGFITNVIITNSLYSFSLTEITQKVNSTFSFKIPEAIIQSSLKKLKNSIKKEYGKYSVDFASLNKNNQFDLIERDKTLQNSNNELVSNLFTFIEGKQNKALTDDIKKEITQCFCSFVINDQTNNDFSEYISAFIIEKQNDLDFKQKLNTIKEGVIFYTGLMFNENLGQVGSWNTKIDIYLDTEILFNFAGYSGSLDEILFNDFYSLVKEINNSKKGNLITLKYFTEVKNEIDHFFLTAEKICCRSKILDPSKTAMSNIINGCKTGADIILKKTNFYQRLKTNDIREDDYGDYYENKNHQYNIESNDLFISEISNLHAEKTAENIRFLNFINIKRNGNNNKGFENIGHVLLSGKSNTLRLAWNDQIKEKGHVPLATNLDFLTNRFWFKLNKGFGGQNTPKTFDIITKAQIVLSAQLDKSISHKFEELKQKKLTTDEIIAGIAELRQSARRPEEINAENIADILNFVTEEKIENYIREKDFVNSKLEEEKSKSNVLRDENATLKHQLMQREFEETTTQINGIEKNKKIIDRQISRKIWIIIVSIIMILFLGCVGIIFYFDWNKIEAFVSLLLPLIAWVIQSIKGHSFNPFKWLTSDYKKQQTIKHYQLKGINELENLKNSLELKGKLEDVNY